MVNTMKHSSSGQYTHSLLRRLSLLSLVVDLCVCVPYIFGVGKLVFVVILQNLPYAYRCAKALN